MWQVKLRIAFVMALVAGGASVAVIVWQARQLALLRQSQVNDARTLAQLRDLLKQREKPQTPAEPEEEESREPSPAPRRPSHSNTAELQARDAQIRFQQQELEDGRANVGRLESRIFAMEGEQQAAASKAADRFAAMQADWKNRVDTLTRQLDAAQAEAQIARQRSIDLAAAAARDKAALPDTSASAAESARLVARLQDLNRRRDAYITSILRRYRDVTSQFHAMSGMMNSSHDQTANPMSASALTRIESTVSLVEDDLRQMNELNAQAQQAEKKLAALAAPTRVNP